MPVVYDTYVPHSGSINAKILLIGESPGVDEEAEGKPFVGASGKLLIATLLRHGIDREDVRLANLCNYRPQNNKFEILEETADGKRKLASGLKELISYINSSPPNVIGALGEKPLNFLTGKYGIGRYRGSILPCTLGKEFSNIKVIPTRHPAFITRNQSEYPIFDKDIERIVGDSNFGDFRYTERNYYIIRDGIEAIEWFDKLSKEPILAVDIENFEDTPDIICIAFASSKNTSICFPWNIDFIPYIAKLLESNIKKIFQFGTHDTEILYLNGIKVANYFMDTLVAMHSLEPEFPKGLDFMTSIYTREPYYKKEGRSDLPRDSKVWSKKTEKNSIYVYNAKDSAVTYEIAEKQLIELAVDPAALAVYEHEMSMLEVAANLSRTGMLVDLELREIFSKELHREWNNKQAFLDTIAGKEVNVNSSKDMPWLFYTKLKLPIKRKRGGGITTDEDALVYLITYCASKVEELIRESSKEDWQIKLEACKLCLEIRGIRKMISSYVEARLSLDNRYRSTYIVAGPETGRWAASQYVDASGVNSQTYPRSNIEVRDV